MDDLDGLDLPELLSAILRATEEYGFAMASELRTGAFLRTLATTKPHGQFLEIGTGTGVGTCWILAGMDAHSQLTTVEQDAGAGAIARACLSHDSRVRFITTDAAAFLQQDGEERYDFIFADTFPGKFSLLDETLQRLAEGGIYVIDDLLPQATWPPAHQAMVDALIATLDGRRDLHVTKLQWASGLIVAAKRESR